MRKYHLIVRQNDGVLELSLPFEMKDEYDALIESVDARDDVRDSLPYECKGFRECSVCEIRVSFALSAGYDKPIEEVA